MNRFVGAFFGELWAYTCLICAATIVVSASSATAQTTATFEDGIITLSVPQYTQETDRSRRIELSGQLRMLSQRIVADACFAQSGIATRDTIPALNATASQVNEIVHALEFGDVALGVFGAEQRRRTLDSIAQLKEVWAPMQTNALLIGQGDGDAIDIIDLNAQGAAFLKVAHMLTAVVATQYALPAELRQADALLIEIAGRQQLLSQQMSKNTCLVSAGLEVEAALEELNTARAAFDSSLGALLGGMPKFGIQAPPSSAIDAGLSEVRVSWALMQRSFISDLSTGAMDENELSVVYYGAVDLTDRMVGIIDLYFEETKFDS